MLQQGAPEEMDHTVSAALRAELRCAQELVRLSQTDKDNLDYLIKAGDITASGNDKLGQTIAKAVGYGTDSMDNFSTIANRVNQSNLNYLSGQLALQNRYRTTTGTGSGRRSSGTSRSTKSGSASSKVDGYTQPQLNTMFKEYSTMKPDDQRRSYYEDTLADAGLHPAADWHRQPRQGQTAQPGSRACTTHGRWPTAGTARTRSQASWPTTRA